MLSVLALSFASDEAMVIRVLTSIFDRIFLVLARVEAAGLQKDGKGREAAYYHGCLISVREAGWGF